MSDATIKIALTSGEKGKKPRLLEPGKDNHLGEDGRIWGCLVMAEPNMKS
jgi:hypothetical protein